LTPCSRLPRPTCCPLRLLMCVPALLLAACGGASGAPVTPPSAPAASPVASSANTLSRESTAPASLTPVAIAYNGPTVGFAPLFVGQAAGIFRSNGLDASLKLIPGAPASTAALIAGQVQFSQVGGGAAVSAAVAGADLAVLAIVGPVNASIIEAAPNIKTGADLKGKKIGVTSLAGGGDTDIAMRVGLQLLGLDPDKDVTVLAVGNNAPQALLGGAVDAALMTPPDNLQVESKGFHPLLDLAATKKPHLGQATVATRSFVAAHSDLTQRYIDALIQSIAKLKQDEPFTISVLKQALKTDDEANLKSAYDFYAKEVFPSLPEPKKELFQDGIAALGKDDPRVRDFDPNKIIDATFVKSANARGLGQEP
jgi:NitT/TauT family transport system substrate-binding protein